MLSTTRAFSPAVHGAEMRSVFGVGKHRRTSGVLWWLGLVGFAIVCAVAFRPVRSTVRAVSIAYRFSDSHPLLMRAYWRLVTRQVQVSEIEVPGRAGGYRAKSFVPVGVTNAPVFVVVHGFVRDGMEDGPTATIATELASDGFRVLVPNIASEQDMVMDPAAVDEINDVVHWARQESGRPVNLMGVSFGGGLALRAASMPGFAGDVKTTFCVGAFNNVERLGAFYTGAGAIEPRGAVDKTTPAEVGGPVMAVQHMDEMVPAADVPVMLDLMRNVLMVQTGMPVVQAKLATLSPRLQDEFKLLMTTDGAQGERYMKMWARHHDAYDAISPHNHLSGVQSEVYLLHGANDPLVSEAEARWNAYELTAAGKKVHLLLSPYLLHWDMQKGTTLRGKMQIALFLARVLGDAEN